MESDLLLVIGIIVTILAFPSLLNAFSTGRPPKTAALLLIVGGGLITWAVIQKPNAYTFEQLPDVFTRVVAGIIR